MFMALLMRNTPSNQAPWTHGYLYSQNPNPLYKVHLRLASPSSPKTQAHSRPHTLKNFRFFHILSSLSEFFKWAHLYVQKQQNYVHRTPMHSDTWHTPLMHNLYMHDLCTCVASQNHKNTSTKGPWVGPHLCTKTHHNVSIYFI